MAGLSAKVRCKGSCCELLLCCIHSSLAIMDDLSSCNSRAPFSCIIRFNLQYSARVTSCAPNSIVSARGALWSYGERGSKQDPSAQTTTANIWCSSQLDLAKAAAAKIVLCRFKFLLWCAVPQPLTGKYLACCYTSGT